MDPVVFFFAFFLVVMFIGVVKESESGTLLPTTTNVGTFILDAWEDYVLWDM